MSRTDPSSLSEDDDEDDDDDDDEKDDDDDDDRGDIAIAPWRTAPGSAVPPDPAWDAALVLPLDST